MMVLREQVDGEGSGTVRQFWESISEVHCCLCSKYPKCTPPKSPGIGLHVSLAKNYAKAAWKQWYFWKVERRHFSSTYNSRRAGLLSRLKRAVRKNVPISQLDLSGGERVIDLVGNVAAYQNEIHEPEFAHFEPEFEHVLEVLDEEPDICRNAPWRRVVRD